MQPNGIKKCNCDKAIWVKVHVHGMWLNCTETAKGSALYCMGEQKH